MVKTRATIAVVDDDAGVRTALRELLRSAGYQALTFESAEDFLADRREDIDFLIADVNLPGMSGVALLDALAARGATLPALLITGRGDAGTIDLIRQAATVPRLIKPFSDDDLFEVIGNALEV